MRIDKQIRLLHESLDKWERVRSGNIPSVGSSDCPLCVEYNDPNNPYCKGCPLKEQGEEFDCHNKGGIYQRFMDNKTYENACEMVNMLEYMIDLYEIKKVHDES